MKLDPIYMDEAATTKPYEEVVASMLPFLQDKFGNPSSVHSKGREAAKALSSARTTIANHINAQPEEIIFTSGGTEGDNLCIKGYCLANMHKGKHIVTTAIEHPAVYESCKWLQSCGFQVTYVKPSKHGQILLTDIVEAVKYDTILVSVMTVNNELGTAQSVELMAQECKKLNPKLAFHTDAVQGFGNYIWNMSGSTIDMMSMSGHKIHGPKGTGFCYIRKGLKLVPLIHGGGQENGLRSGTENVPGIIGLAKAVQMQHVAVNKPRLIDVLQRELAKYTCDFRATVSVCRNIASVRFVDVDADQLMLMLDEHGLCCSTGSACSAWKHEPSRVLTAIGLSKQESGSVIRFSIADINIEELKQAIQIIKTCLFKLQEET